MHVFSVVGARPQFIKAAMVSRSLSLLPDIREVLVHTGQHYDPQLNDIFFTDVNDGEVFVVDVNDRSAVKFLYSTEGYPVSFSQGPDGYMYVANLAGTIARLLIVPIEV